MPDQHARLSPSASERWIRCPASIKMESLVPRGVESLYAREGTAAHALGELKASLEFNLIDGSAFMRKRIKWSRTWNVEPEIEAEMEGHTDAYVTFLKERMQAYPDTVIMLERRLDTGIPTCWGTSDAVLVSPQHVEIVDFKYGSGVKVYAMDNPQLRLYGLGALDTYGDILGDTEKIYITVFQPRIVPGTPDTETLSPDDLRAWRRKIIPIAQEALGENPHFGPSEEACRWCPASGRCQAQLQDVFKIDFFDEPRLLSEEDIAKHLGLVKHVRAWLDAFEVAALSAAYSENKTIPGYKVVLSNGKRYVTDPEEAIKVLTEAGYDFDLVGKRTARGIGELEKLLGAAKFRTMLEESGLVRKTEGKPSIVPEDDRRKAIDPNSEAAKEFQE